MQYLLTCLFLLLAAILSFVSGRLTLMAAFAGFGIGLLVYQGANVCGIILLGVFFIAGSWATGYGLGKKQIIGFAEKNKGRRTTTQVLANGGVAALLGELSWYDKHFATLVPLMIAGSLAAAIADTLASELGMIYGSTFINILTFEQDQCGLDGVISLEGTLTGAAGAVAIAAVYATGFGWSKYFWFIIAAGVTGNLADSLLGATLQRKGVIGNNAVNFLNTLTGALVCLGLATIF